MGTTSPAMAGLAIMLHAPAPRAVASAQELHWPSDYGPIAAWDTPVAAIRR